jgi:hypothetical protein
VIAFKAGEQRLERGRLEDGIEIRDGCRLRSFLVSQVRRSYGTDA